LPLQRDEIRLARFGTGIRDAYATLDGSGDHVDIDLYEHEGSEVTQVSMYVADLSDVALEFEGPQLTSRERQLAREAAILYSSETGALDVIAPGGSAVRASLAALFIEQLLENDRPVERIVLRQYNLHSLRSRRTFPVDARTEFTLSRFAAFASSRGMGAVADCCRDNAAAATLAPPAPGGMVSRCGCRAGRVRRRRSKDHCNVHGEGR
jgi:hypothetical protein